ncbi:MAG: DNA repair exonuclease [Epsilonproteobacteria bacterium]|nr:DNA repair exonuclease [Campylobacterota bacterium]
MKILHFSDTHLGFSEFDGVNKDNINKREADFYDAFLEVFKQIRHLKPDYIIHTGDFFHRISPSNRAITFAVDIMSKINSLNIPFVMIAGNHETPRSVLSAPILSIFDSFENVYVAYKQCYEVFEFDEVVFHALPHINDEAQRVAQIEQISPHPSKMNICLLHCSIKGDYLMEEFGEFVYPQDKLAVLEQMDYVALGHWHGFKKVFANAYYSGSLAATSISDTRAKGFVMYDTHTKKANFLQIPYRKIIKQTIQDIAQIDTTHTKDAIVEITLTNLTPARSLEISNADIKELLKDAFYVVIKREFIDSAITYQNIESISIEDYFISHLEQNNAKHLIDKAKELFAKVELED